MPVPVKKTVRIIEKDDDSDVIEKIENELASKRKPTLIMFPLESDYENIDKKD